MIRLIFNLFLAFMCLTTAFATQKVENYNTKQPSVFYQNKGQIIDQDRKVRKDVRYHYSAPGFTLSITDKGMSWTVTKTERIEKKSKELEGNKFPSNGGARGRSENDSLVFYTHRVDVEFVGANMMIPIEEAQVQGYYQNFYTEYTGEQGITSLHGAKQITLKNVWNGIDMVFQAKEEGKLEYDFILHTNANIKDIQLKYNGQNGLQLIQNELKIMTAQGEVRETIPMSYEKENSKAVTVGYQLNNNIVSFATKSEYNKENTLVIDPSLLWGTYLGGSGTDIGYGVTTDVSNNVIIMGSTTSTSNIATSGTHQTTNGGVSDVFVSQFSSTGTLLWSSYYGGAGQDFGYAIACDGSGNSYITGETNSTSGLGTSGTHQPSRSGGWESFIAKFNSTGTLSWGTYYGGSGDDYGRGIIVSSTNNIYVTGNTQSTSLIATSGTHKTSYTSTGNDVFLAKFNSSSGTRVWGTYYGGSSDDIGYGIILDASENVYITGTTTSSSGIASSGAHKTSYDGQTDVFIAKFSSAGSRQWGTYYGGSFVDNGYGLALDASNNIYITGNTKSTSGIATSGAHKTTTSGNEDAFITKFSSSGVQLWGTYYGGTGTEISRGVTTDGSGNAYIVGETNSSTDIATSGSYKTSRTGGNDIYVSQFSSTGILSWATYYGGISGDLGRGIVINSSGDLYITGNTNSTSGIATSGSHQTTTAGLQDVLLVKFEFPPSCVAPNKPNGKDTTFCSSGGSHNITLKATHGNGRYRWYNVPTGGSALDTNSNYTVSLSSSSTYYVSSTNGICESTRDTLVVTINTTPTNNLGNDTSVSSGTILTLGSSSVLGYSYLWSTGATTAQITDTFLVSKKHKLTVTESGCSSVDSIHVIVNQPISYKQWTGFVDSTWDNKYNWTPASVPTFTDSVVIPSVYNKPCYFGTASKCNSIYVASGAKIYRPSNSVIELKRHFYSDGILDGEYGAKTIFSGTTRQRVGSPTNKGMAFSHWDVNNIKGVSLTSNVTTRGFINLISGSIFTTGKLTLDFNNKSAGGILPLLDSFTVNGNVRVIRGITSPVSGWTLMSPTTQQAKLNAWGGTLKMYGFHNRPTNPYGTGSSVYWYDETKAGVKDTGWKSASKYFDSLQLGKGWNIYVGVSKTSASAKGKIQKGNFTFPITYTNTGNSSADGWNLVGNPYPCAIDWNAASGWTKTNISSTIYVFDEHISQYAPWNGTIGTTTQSQYIAVGQGFFVKATGSSPVLISTESVKTTTHTTLKKTEANNVLRIKAITSKGNEDNAVIVLDNQATEQFDENLDAVKWRGHNVHLSTTDATGERMSLNYLPTLNPNTETKKIVPIQVEGANSLQFSNLNSFDDFTHIYLYDAKENKLIDLKEQQEYQFQTGDYTQRFSVVFSKEVINEQEIGIKHNLNPEVVIYPNPADNSMLTIQGVSQSANLRIMDMNGKTLYQQPLQASDKQTVNTQLPQGMYLVEITLPSQVVMKKWMVK